MTRNDRTDAVLYSVPYIQTSRTTGVCKVRIIPVSVPSREPVDTRWPR